MKSLVAEKCSEFWSTSFQDSAEFLNCLIQECQQLRQLTKCEIISSYHCTHCNSITDDADSDERIKNIVHLNINGDSLAEIISNAQTKV